MATQPVIVPPAPVVPHGEPPVQPDPTADVAKNLQSIFDRVVPPVGPEKKEVNPTAQTPKEPVAPPQPPEPPPATQAQEPVPPKKEPTLQEAEHTLPPSIESLLSGEASPAQSPPAPAEVEIPEVLPENPEERRNNWKNFREEYKKLKEELRNRSAQPQTDPQVQERLSFLEQENKNLMARVNTYDIQTHSDFQQQIIRPMAGALNAAKKIIADAGGSPQELEKALTLHGRGQYEALDTIMGDLPESARLEANQHIAAYKQFDLRRQAALANAPETIKQMRQADMKRHQQALAEQRSQMNQMYDAAVAILRDKAKVELLQTATGEGAQKWNEDVQAAIEQGRNLLLENTSMEKVAMACVLAPLVDRYRNLFLNERKARMKAEGTLKERFGSEPVIGGPDGGSKPSSSADLKRPFKDVFMEELQRQRQAGFK